MDEEAGYRDAIATTAEIIEEARHGRMFILVDHEDRENEGDLIIPAEMASADVVNFMAIHGRGLISTWRRECAAFSLSLRPEADHFPRFRLGFRRTFLNAHEITRLELVFLVMRRITLGASHGFFKQRMREHPFHSHDHCLLAFVADD